jgi:hypothetical protein
MKECYLGPNSFSRDSKSALFNESSNLRVVNVKCGSEITAASVFSFSILTKRVVRFYGKINGTAE